MATLVDIEEHTTSEGVEVQVEALIDLKASHNLLSLEAFCKHFHHLALSPTPFKMIAVSGHATNVVGSMEIPTL